MPLTTCPDCNAKISTLAEACPHCGRPVEAVTAEETTPLKEEAPPKSSEFKQRALHILGIATQYVIGTFFVLAGLITLIASIITGLIAIAIGITLIPPAWNWLSGKLPITLPSWGRWVLTGGLVVLFSIVLGREGDRAEEERAAQLVAQEEKAVQAERALFASGRDSILAEVRDKAEREDWEAVMAIRNQFARVNDPELEENTARATQALQEKENREKEKNLLAQLKEASPKDARARYGVYNSLAELRPENTKYVTERDRLGKVVATAEREERELEERIGPMPVRSGWDNSYREVGEYLRQVARDPESVEIEGCGEAARSEKGWIVSCVYRARNGFGGMNREAAEFVIRQRQVVAMDN